MDYFDKRYHIPGTPPGTLVQHDTGSRVPLRIKVVDYSETEYQEKILASGVECKPFLSRPSQTWIQLQGNASPDEWRGLGKLLELHPLAMEDVLNAGQRPKVDEYNGQLFIVLSLPVVSEEGLVFEQVSLFVSDNLLVSFYAGASDPFEPIVKRLRKDGCRFRRESIDYLLYAVVDLIIDQGFPLLESIGDTLETLEEGLLDVTDKELLNQIHRTRRKLTLMRRVLWPQREVLNHLLNGDLAIIQESTKVYLRDCYDHTIQIIDLIESYRETATSMIEVYMSSISHRLNDIMRVLTVIATIFIPLTFIVGVYGMNFSHPGSPWAMPELHWYYGYPLVWLVMFALVVGMLVYFKRRDWL